MRGIVIPRKRQDEANSEPASILDNAVFEEHHPAGVGGEAEEAGDVMPELQGDGVPGVVSGVM